MTLLGVHHLGLTVADVERSARWYCAVLDFFRVGEFGGPDDPRRKVFLNHPGFRLRLGLVEHRGGAGDRFDETRTGLDHLAFSVPDGDHLDRWAARIAEHGVEFSPAVPANTVPGASVIVLRDPDGIQLELFADPERSRRR
ncbi:VOC family protein [Actinomycetospora aeridis]|uniref:VOC family protein n=1 Tax=Actinomycetospora aeridis TaxID=3129231 RepID=A0ABU8NAM6_9PSEU